MYLNDIYNLISSEIRVRFPEVNLEFEAKSFRDRSELWVYVLDRKWLSEVEAYCRLLEKRPIGPQIPLRIIVKTWTGTWPGGESEQDIRDRRRKSLA